MTMNSSRSSAENAEQNPNLEYFQDDVSESETVKVIKSTDENGCDNRIVTLRKQLMQAHLLPLQKSN